MSSVKVSIYRRKKKKKGHKLLHTVEIQLCEYDDVDSIDKETEREINRFITNNPGVIISRTECAVS